MIKGKLIHNIPLIQTTLVSGSAVRRPFVILDTGFTGDLLVSNKVAKELGLKPIGVESVNIAGEKAVDMQSAIALANMEGITKSVQVLISQGGSLVGISFFKKFGYKAIVDCKNKLVTLERVA